MGGGEPLRVTASGSLDGACLAAKTSHGPPQRHAHDQVAQAPQLQAGEGSTERPEPTPTTESSNAPQAGQPAAKAPTEAPLRDHRGSAERRRWSISKLRMAKLAPNRPHATATRSITSGKYTGREEVDDSI